MVDTDQVAETVVETVALGDLLPADSPRLSGVNGEHVQVLAESVSELPPILVDRRTMRVIDGMHRLRAAALCGVRRIEVRYFDGPGEAAFLTAVKENVRHGLPLSRADREAAVVRILGEFADLSDRAVAAICGVSHSTVGAIRRRATVQDDQLPTRTGLDGRVRPLNSAAGRRAAQRILAERRDASLREIAEMTGISPNTVRDVRERMRRGEDPVPSRRHRAGRGGVALSASSVAEGDIDVREALGNMKRDPSLRFTDAGRRLLRWLDVQAANLEHWQDLVGAVPAYHVSSVASLARRYAQVLEAFAARLDDHGSAEIARSTDTA
jgi:ParB-like chromosome segregation protein Spo0J